MHLQVRMVEVEVVDLRFQVIEEKEVKETSLQFLEYKVFLADVLRILDPLQMVAVAVVLVKEHVMQIELFQVVVVMEAMEVQLELKALLELVLLAVVEEHMVELVELVEAVMDHLLVFKMLVVELQTLAVVAVVVIQMAELVVLAQLLLGTNINRG